jgi:hypothetical protein
VKHGQRNFDSSDFRSAGCGRSGDPDLSHEDESSQVRRAIPAKGENNMDNVTLIRVISGVLAVAVLCILIYRMKKTAPK